jgi:hypothetical protein
MAKAAAGDCHVKFDVLRCARRCFVILIRKSRRSFDSWRARRRFRCRAARTQCAVELPSESTHLIASKSSREKLSSCSAIVVKDENLDAHKTVK